MRTFLSWTLPGGLLLLVAMGLDRWAGAHLLVELTRGYPWVACAGAFLLATLFHRSRVGAATLVLAVAAWGLGAGWPPALASTAVVVALAVLAPLHDRGIAAPGSVGQWIAAGVVLGVAAMLVGGGAPEVAAALTAGASPATGALARLGLSPARLGVVGVAALLVAVPALRRRGPVERAFLWCLLVAVVGLRPGAGAGTAGIYVLAAALTLALSVIETSYAMAYRDELTGLPARRALLRDLDALSPPYALAMVDVDHFKKFNDRHGHETGDQVLRMVAGRLARGPSGVRAYRYGGEEFTLVLPGRDRERALDALEAVRSSVAEASFAVRSWTRPAKKPAAGKKKPAPRAPRRLSVTVSIGVADSASAGKEGPAAVLQKADKALYRAKRAGRNRVSK